MLENQVFPSIGDRLKIDRLIFQQIGFLHIMMQGYVTCWITGVPGLAGGATSSGLHDLLISRFLTFSFGVTKRIKSFLGYQNRWTS
jgi:hypothetical protein